MRIAPDAVAPPIATGPVHQAADNPPPVETQVTSRRPGLITSPRRDVRVRAQRRRAECCTASSCWGDGIRGQAGRAATRARAARQVVDARRDCGRARCVEVLGVPVGERRRLRAEEFWSALTGISARQFQKPYRAVADETIRRNRHVNGCPAMSYGCTATHRRVMGMIEAVLSRSAVPG